MIGGNLLRRCGHALRADIIMVGNSLQRGVRALGNGVRALGVGVGAVVGNPLRIYAHALRTNNNTWFYTFVVFAIISLIMTVALGGFGPIYQSKVDVGQESEASQMRHNMARGFGAKTNDQLTEGQLGSLPHGQSGLITVRHWIARKIFLWAFIAWSVLAFISIFIVFRDEVGDLFRRFRQRLNVNAEETDEEKKVKNTTNSGATGGTAVNVQTPPTIPPAAPQPAIQPTVGQGQPINQGQPQSLTERFIMELIAEWLAEVVFRSRKK